MTEAIEKVRAIPLFAGLDDDALGRVASLFSEVEAPANQVIVEHGMPGPHVPARGGTVSELPAHRGARTG
jgi:hypothetical protein